MSRLEKELSVEVNELILSRSQGLASAVSKNRYIKLIGCFKDQTVELLQIEVEVELPQHPPVPINQFEQLLIRIGNEIDSPKVFALRTDFPKTIHQNIVPDGCPAWLCLYEDPWEEISPFITPELFLERIREWLHRAAIEELHLGDQPLEPFLVTSQRVFIDEDLLKFGLPKDHILAGTLQGDIPLMTPIPLNDLTRFIQSAKQKKEKQKSNFLGIQVSGEPTFTQVIQRLPKNLHQLMTLLRNVNVDLENELKVFFRGMMQHNKISKYGDFQLIIFLHLPKSRHQGDVPESHEYWAFYINSTINNLGIALGVLDSASEVGVGYVLQGPIQIEQQREGDKGYSELLVEPLSPVFTFTPALARRTSGIPNGDIENLKIGVVGLGALGSTIVMNLARQGIGKWTLIDNDILFPHNLARHSLSGAFVGLPKVAAMQQSLGIDYHGISNVEQFFLNFLDLASDSEEVPGECYKKLASANLILDFSASAAVERKLSLDDFPAPRISVYLVPSGKYCIASHEGYGRSIRLDDLNQQLMVEVAQNPELHDLFSIDDNKIQYAGSCRDLSQVIANDSFLGYAGVISKFIKQNLTGQDPKLSVFKWQENPQLLCEIPVSLTSFTVSKYEGWEIRSSEFAISLMKKYRNARLPNETGGVVLGKIDYAQQSIYISHVLPSPPDSKEWPMAYIRGVKGLHQEVHKIREVTKDALAYVGEWHSHPAGAGTKPSKDDKIALNWVSDFQSSIGYPGLLAIIGDEALPNYLLSRSKLSSR
jgi:hypothetical protein